MGLFSKIRKGVTKTAKKVGAVNAGLVSGLSLGLVKPKTLGVKSKDATHLANQVARGTKVAAAVTAVGFAGAGFAGAGPLSGLKSFFGLGQSSPPVPASMSGLPIGAPSEPESTFGTSFNQRLETLGQVSEGGGFEGQQQIGGIMQNKMLLFGLGIAVLLAGILLFRRK